MLKKTKIVCTIGPSSWSRQTLKMLADSCMDVARLNFSHGKHEEKKQQIELIRKISEDLKKPLAIIADLQGPKLRLGLIDSRVEIKKGEIIKLSTEPEQDELLIQFDLTPFVKPKERIFLNDGLVELEVVEIKDKVITAKALNNGWVSSNKGVNVPDTNLAGASFTPKDQEDANFALLQDVDYLALSFVQSIDDIKPARELIKKLNSKTKIIVKIEKKGAIENIEEIVETTDAVMIARGDLAIETEASLVPIAQQKIIKLCRQFQKPVIVATQMLESMTENPRPTRAETSDVANAVLDQVDAVMLSAETASGRYPVETVQTMASIIKAVEEHPDYKHYIKINWENLAKEEVFYSAITSTAASLAYRINAKAIVIPTTSGRSAKFLSSFRPSAKIVAVTHDPKVRNQLSLVWGVDTLLLKLAGNLDELVKDVIKSILESNYAKPNDQIVIVTGSTVGLSGATDTIRVINL